MLPDNEANQQDQDSKLTTDQQSKLPTAFEVLLPVSMDNSLLSTNAYTSAGFNPLPGTYYWARLHNGVALTGLWGRYR